MKLIANQLVLKGRVQGVGLRPYLYRIAKKNEICGWVKNDIGQVRLYIEGGEKNITSFLNELSLAPLPAQFYVVKKKAVCRKSHTKFSILPSSKKVDDVYLLPDLPPCSLCLNELFELNNRRYRYPFINCSHCGPRYTLIHQLPYDRCNTSMEGFVLCEACNSEYITADDARFHAQSISCETCGPKLSYLSVTQKVTGNNAAMAAAVTAIREGKIVAIKGIGGFHLVCDATNLGAIHLLRQRKKRPHKPLAIMGTVSQLSEWVEFQNIHLETLHSPTRPIVLVPSKLAQSQSASLAIQTSNLAPALQELGVMLSYSPLHHVLINDLDRPLVVTSANLSGEPVLIDNDEVMHRLDHVADALLLHNRNILHPVDDSVYRLIAGEMRPLRLGRGNAPLELTLPFNFDEPLLAMGGHIKNSIALAWQKRIIISPHIGDLQTPRTQKCLQKNIADLSQLYQVSPKKVVMDTHPSYGYRRWVKTSALPSHEIPHHYSHAAQLAGEYPNVSRWLVFTWDGMGLGPDKSLWGGEALLGEPGAWRRQASIRQFRLLGGDLVAKQPWRSAAALCWEIGLVYQPPDNNPLHQQAWKKHINTHECSSIGRLFDAASALLRLGDESSYEGQGPMILEAMAGDTNTSAIELSITQDQKGVWRTDWAPLLMMLQNQQYSREVRAGIFHESLAQLLVQQAQLIRKLEGEFVVGLSGGVFQNKRLSDSVVRRLQTQGFQVYLPSKLPMNDAGLAFGQLIEYHAMQDKKNE